jgi:hypothetical protein
MHESGKASKANEENEPPRGMRHQRPQRTAVPSRRALEALENNMLINHAEIFRRVGGNIR